jgi:integrase
MRNEPSSKKIAWTRENVGYRILADGKRSYCYRYRDADGIQRCPFLGSGSTEKQAIAALANVTVAASRGDAIRVSREPFTLFAERWLTDREAELERTTIDSYRWHYKQLLKPSRHFRKPISKISTNDVAAFILDLKKYRKPNGEPLKGWTMRGAVSVLSGILTEAVDQGVLASNPVQKVSRKKREKVGDESAKRVLTADEIEWLVDSAEKRGLRWGVLAGLGVYAGLRLGEALGLQWHDIDLDAGMLRVRRQRDAKTGASRDLKTIAGKREIPIASPLRRLLVEWKLQSSRVADLDPVISTVTGKSVSQRNGLRTLCEIAESCDINVPRAGETPERPNLDFHSLRHTFASAMIKATKGDAERVRRWMGHADTKVLLERYSHEFESVRGGRGITEEIAEMDAAYGGSLHSAADRN